MTSIFVFLLAHVHVLVSFHISSMSPSLVSHLPQTLLRHSADNETMSKDDVLSPLWCTCKGSMKREETNAKVDPYAKDLYQSPLNIDVMVYLRDYTGEVKEVGSRALSLQKLVQDFGEARAVWSGCASHLLPTLCAKFRYAAKIPPKTIQPVVLLEADENAMWYRKVGIRIGNQDNTFLPYRWLYEPDESAKIPFTAAT